jgi:hypothetical protein
MGLDIYIYIKHLFTLQISIRMMNEEDVQQGEQRVNPGRLRPCTLRDECQHLFLTVLSQHPFLETFYYGPTLPNAVRCPQGQKGIRLANTLARLNTEDFHIRNGSLGRPWSENTVEAARLRLFAQYALPGNGNMSEECCAVMENIFESANAIRRVDDGDAEQQAAANDARYVI